MIQQFRNICVLCATSSKFKKERQMHILKQKQFLPISLDRAWEFFTTPKNLNEVLERYFLV